MKWNAGASVGEYRGSLGGHAGYRRFRCPVGERLARLGPFEHRFARDPGGNGSPLASFSGAILCQCLNTEDTNDAN